MVLISAIAANDYINDHAFTWVIQQQHWNSMGEIRWALLNV
jgi:hypothetical protein